MKQSNKLIEFRQAVYDHGLARFADAQLDLVDALLFSPPIRKPRALARRNLSAAEGGTGFSPQPPSFQLGVV